MKIINQREIALEALNEILLEGGYSNIVLKRFLKQNRAMTKTQKAFVTEIVNGTIRRLITLDYYINEVSSVSTYKMKPILLNIIRISLYQFLYMDKVPSSAICNEAVELTKKRGYKKLTSFVNGVLRNLMRHEFKLPNPDKTSDYISIKTSHPRWLVKMLLKDYDKDFVNDMLEKNNEIPKISVSVNTLKITAESFLEKAELDGLHVLPSSYINSAFYISGTSDISELSSYKNGYFQVQDESSMLASLVSSPKKEYNVLDMCSAPGGKSFFMAKLMDNTGKITACDIHEHKIQLMSDRILELGITNINSILKDMLIFDESFSNRFDLVVLDAPCSGLGLIRRKPDIKLKKNKDDIAALTAIQRTLLDNAFKYTKPGGKIVYSTCTITKEENILNRNWFLTNYNVTSENIENILPSSLVCDTKKEGYMSLFPHIHGTDGFFIASFIKKENMND